MQYSDLVLSLLVAPSTRRNLDDTLNHHPNLGTLQLARIVSSTSFVFVIALQNNFVCGVYTACGHDCWPMEIFTHTIKCEVM
jgi:hypothetical protein